MTTSVSLSTRVSPELRQRLVAEARARRIPLGSLARDLLAAGLDGGPLPSDGAVVNEVQCKFHGLPPDSGVYREVCLALARTVEAGGTAGVTAGRELLSVVDHVERLFVPDDWDEDTGADDGDS
jgi:hypothetical protein